MLLDNIALAIHDNLQGAEVIALVENPRDDIRHDGYWERSFIVVWKRIAHGSQPTEDGYVYCTHRVHVNSEDKAACFMGHYDQTRERALADMLDRANITLPVKPNG